MIQLTHSGLDYKEICLFLLSLNISGAFLVLSFLIDLSF